MGIKELFIGSQKYIINTHYVEGAILILLAIAVAYIASSGFDKSQHLYIKCDTQGRGGYCDNPLYHNWKYCSGEAICEKELIPDGYEYGTPPPKILEIFPLVAGFLLIGAITINHFINNKNFNWKIFGEDLKKDIDRENEGNKDPGTK